MSDGAGVQPTVHTDHQPHTHDREYSIREFIRRWEFTPTVHPDHQSHTHDREYSIKELIRRWEFTSAVHTDREYSI